MELFVGGFSIDYLLHVLILRKLPSRQTDRQTDRPRFDALTSISQQLQTTR